MRERPVPIPNQPAELAVDGRPFPAPITVSPVVQAVRYGFVWCPTDDLERCVVPDPAAALGSAAARAALPRARRHGPRLERAAPAARLERLARERRAAPRATAGRDSILWIAVAAVALAVRRPRGSAPILVLAGVAALVLVVHALSQAPQNEFALPFAPVWIAAALVGLLAPRDGPS